MKEKDINSLEYTKRRSYCICAEISKTSNIHYFFKMFNAVVRVPPMQFKADGGDKRMTKDKMNKKLAKK